MKFTYEFKSRQENPLAYLRKDGDINIRVGEDSVLILQKCGSIHMAKTLSFNEQMGRNNKDVEKFLYPGDKITIEL